MDVGADDRQLGADEGETTTGGSQLRLPSTNSLRRGNSSSKSLSSKKDVSRRMSGSMLNPPPAKSIKAGNHKTKLLKELSIMRDGPRSFPVFVESDPFWSRAWGVVNPRHVFVQMWDLNTLFLLVFTCLVTPYEIAFLDEVNGTGVEVLFYVNQLINIVFVVDMVLVFFLPLEGPNGSWITAKPALALSYFKRMFIIDAISVIPFDVIAASQENKSLGDLKVFRIFKLFRLLKMLRIFRGLRIVKRYETDYAIDYQALNIASLLISLITTAHWIACLLAMICRYDSKSPDLVELFPNMIIATEKPSSLKYYFYCFTWGLSWITTGEGGGHEESLISSSIRVYITFLLIIGAIANAAIIGGVMTVVDEMNLAVREFYGSLNTLNAFLRIENVMAKKMSWRGDVVQGKDFCRRLRKFYIFKYSNEKQYLCLSSILGNVSGDMKRIVADAMYGDIMRKCTVFKNASTYLIAHIAVEMRVEVYARGDVIYERTDGANDLYFTRKGTIMLSNNSIDMYRVGGEPFGLEVIYKKGAPRGRMAVSVTESVVIAVDGDAIHDAIDKYSEPTIRWRVLMTNTLLKVAKALTDAVNLTLEDHVCDVSRGVKHLNKQLGNNVLLHIDGKSGKKNNLLAHFKRLTRRRLISQRMTEKEIKRHMRKFEPLQARYDEAVRRARILHAKEKQLLALLKETKGVEGGTMEKWYKTLVNERINTISHLKRLGAAEFRLMDIPLGDALSIMDNAKTADDSLLKLPESDNEPLLLSLGSSSDDEGSSRFCS